MPSRFFQQDVSSGLKDKRKLSTFLDQLVQTHLPGTKKIALSYIFCTDDYLLSLNKQFLEHDTFTDIVTFDLSPSDKVLQGELYISTDRVRENAEVFGTGYHMELHRVIFHGALHLCGFGDKTPEEVVEMRKQEENCLKAYLTQA